MVEGSGELNPSFRAKPCPELSTGRMNPQVGSELLRFSEGRVRTVRSCVCDIVCIADGNYILHLFSMYVVII